MAFIILTFLCNRRAPPTGLPSVRVCRVAVQSMVNDVATMASDVQSHSFLKGLSVQQIEARSKIATQAEFAAGKTIFRQRDAADRFYLIEKGRVGLDYGLPRKRHVQIQTIGPGEALGWSWLAEPYQWQFSATAIDDVTMSFFHVADLREQCARDPKLGYESWNKSHRC